MGKFSKKNERLDAWRLARDHFQEGFRKKKMYVIKLLKKAKKITDEKVRAKRVAKLERLFSKAKLNGRKSAELCAYLVFTEDMGKLVTGLDMGGRTEAEIKGDLVGEGGDRVRAEVGKWREGAKKEGKEANIKKQMEKGLAEWEIKRERRRVKREKKLAAKEEGGKGVKEKVEEQVKEQVKKQVLAKEESESETDGEILVNFENQGGLSGKPLERRENQISQTGKVSVCEPLEIEVETTEQVENVDQSKTEIEGKETSAKEESESEAKEEARIKAENLVLRKRNQMTTDFIFEQKRETRRETKNQLKDTFFLTEEQFQEMELATKDDAPTAKREFRLGKRFANQNRKMDFDESKMRRRGERRSGGGRYGDRRGRGGVRYGVSRGGRGGGRGRGSRGDVGGRTGTVGVTSRGRVENGALGGKSTNAKFERGQSSRSGVGAGGSKRGGGLKRVKGSGFVKKFDGCHPSYVAKVKRRLREKQGKFSGKIVEL